jgi:hypothetical protein
MKDCAAELIRKYLALPSRCERDDERDYCPRCAKVDDNVMAAIERRGFLAGQKAKP